MKQTRIKTLGCSLLLAASSTFSVQANDAIQPPYSWRGINGEGVFPAGDLVTEFWDIPEGVTMPTGKDAQPIQDLGAEARPGTRKNVVWRTLLPHWGHNAPVVMKDRVFVLCAEGWKSDAPELVCLSAVDGKILWQKPVDHLDAWPAEKQKEAKAIRAKELKRWRDYMTWWNRMYWDNEKDTGVVHDASTWGKLRIEAEAAGFRFPAEPPTKPVAPARGNDGLKETIDAVLVENAKRCNRERIHWREGWTTYPQAWYGTTMGSVVGDGTTIYAVTALGAAAAFTPDGERKWLTDLGVEPGGGSPHHYLNGNFSIASPALAGDKLVYFHRDTATFFGVDKASGAIAWKVANPPYEGEADAHPAYLRINPPPRGYHAHMTPGGTPVVMDLGPSSSGNSAEARGTVVAISGHGLVVRVSDGKLLGQVRYEVPEGYALGKKGVAKAPLSESTLYGGGYNSNVGHGDIFVGNHFDGYVMAARLSVDGDTLKQETLWCGTVKSENRNSNLAWFDGKVYIGPRFSHRDDKSAGGYSAVDALTGKLVYTKGGIWSQYLTAVGFTPTLAVARSAEWHDDRLRSPGWCSFSINRMPGMEPVGGGTLFHPPQTQDVQARHIALKGIPYLSWGSSGTTCWGNRIFIRSNDYLWCVGDPSVKWNPPEHYLKLPQKN